MNRDNIDFTGVGICCLCGAGGKNLQKAVIGKFEQYTSCRVLMCGNCVKLCGAKPGKDGGLFVESVDGVPDKVAKASAEFAEAAKKALESEWKKRGDLRWWIAEPFAVAGGRTFGQVAMKKWTDAKDEAFAEKLETIAHFESKSPWVMRCPVCGKPLVLDAPSAEKLEINDVLKFKCPDGCLSFDEIELAEMDSESYDYYVRRLAAGYGEYGDNPYNVMREKESISARSRTAHALDTLGEKVMSKLAGELHEAIHDAGSYGEKCRQCRKNRSYDVCGKCYDEFDAAHPEIRRRVVDGVYGFEKGMNLRGLLEAVERSNKYKASEHCRLWCAASPDNGARGVCGATGGFCKKYDRCESCRKCGAHVEGKPLGNFLATAGMCQHYKDGKCLARCGKDGKWKGREDLDVCTFSADHYVFSDKGEFCGKFKLRAGLDLDAALEASKAGKSYSGFYR